MKIKVQDAFERALVAPAGAAATDMKGGGALENAQVALDLRPIGGFGMMPGAARCRSICDGDDRQALLLSRRSMYAVLHRFSCSCKDPVNVCSGWAKRMSEC